MSVKFGQIIYKVPYNGSLCLILSNVSKKHDIFEHRNLIFDLLLSALMPHLRSVNHSKHDLSNKHV